MMVFGAYPWFFSSLMNELYKQAIGRVHFKFIRPKLNYGRLFIRGRWRLYREIHICVTNN